MFFRACWLFIALLSCSAAHASQCTYDAENSFLSRVVAIDSSGGPVYGPANGAGAPNAPAPLALHGKEVLLIFAQGPHSAYTKYILDILDRHCAKATFFFTGSTALANSSAVRDVAARGHTLAAGPWSASPNFAALPLEGAEAEIEKGLAAVAKASGAPVAPFFRAAPASMPSTTLDYLKERGVSLWDADIASGDTESGLTPTQLANRTLLRIREAGKGIVQFHDTRKVTVDALDSILTGLKLSGFKVVQIVPASSFVPKDEVLAGLGKQAAVEPAAGLDRAKRRRFVHRREDAAKRRVRLSEPDRDQGRQIVRRRDSAD